MVKDKVDRLVALGGGYWLVPVVGFDFSTSFSRCFTTPMLFSIEKVDNEDEQPRAIPHPEQRLDAWLRSSITG